MYEPLREYAIRRVSFLILTKLLLGEEIKLIVDGTILEVANVNRARTQKIRRLGGKVFWKVKKRNLYSKHYKGKVVFEEVYYNG